MPHEGHSSDDAPQRVWADGVLFALDAGVSVVAAVTKGLDTTSNVVSGKSDFMLLNAIMKE